MCAWAVLQCPKVVAKTKTYMTMGGKKVATDLLFKCVRVRRAVTCLQAFTYIHLGCETGRIELGAKHASNRHCSSCACDRASWQSG
jgi:hypothetical protein